MPKFIDTENVITTLGSEPDKLRAEVGKYLDGDGFDSACGNDYVSMDATEATDVDASIFSKKRYIGRIVANNDVFRDMDQWHDYIRRTISTNTNFYDHTFEYNFSSDQVVNTFVNSYHEKNYEDFTKQYDTRLLANFNLLSYNERNSVENIRQISQMITSFDDPLFSIDTTDALHEYFNQFSNRAQNYVGSLESTANKQKNIYFIDNDLGDFYKEEFPFYYQCDVANIPLGGPDLMSNIDLTDKEKNIYQGLKNNISNSTRRFFTTNDATNKNIKITSLTSLLTTTNIASFSEGPDELFLMSQSKIPPEDNSNFFADQLNTVRCIGQIRRLIDLAQRDFKHIIGLGEPLTNCPVYDMGFKIEKFIGTTQGTPIQTFYFKTLTEFIDTQFNYGVKYIYRIKKLVALLGASYRYTDLFYSDLDEDGTIFYRNFDGETAENIPTILTQSKYKAFMNIEVNPSFQIVEMLLNENEQTFTELPVHPPIAQAYNQKNKGSIEFFLRPAGYEGPLESEFVDDKLSADYFYGKYRVYRLDYPPNDMSQFEESFISEVDEKMTLSFPSILERSQKTIDKETAFFEDIVRPHVKYYYAFKSISYHGTESGFSNILEVELLKDSDEYKISVKDYIIKENRDYTDKIMSKRLIRIVPNFERLLFTNQNGPNSYTIGDQDGQSLFSSNTRTFKIRIKSKHTGKTIDVNVNFKLEDLQP